MLRITGYSDRFSVRPGEAINFHVHSENEESYQADIVRLIHGDTNPDGPGFKEELIHTSVSEMYPGKNQPIHAGSYILVPHCNLFNVSSFTISAYIYPTTPIVDVEGVNVGSQAILSKWDIKKETGYGIFINDEGELCLRIGHGSGKVEEFSTGKPLFRKIWYKVGASFDANSGNIKVFQRPFVTNTNGGHGMSMLNPIEDTMGMIETSSYLGTPSQNDCPILIAASTYEKRSGRTIFGGHYKDLTEPLEIPIDAEKFNGKM